MKDYANEKPPRREGGFFDEKYQKSIYCPSCNQKVATHNAFQTNNTVSTCRKCRHTIVYVTETGETVVKPLRQRTTSGGKRF